MENKELTLDMFNIYDVIVFEDENGITQDCVCDITKWVEEIDGIVGVAQCNNHSISIYKNGSYRVWERDGKDLPYYSTNKKITHLYTLKNDNRFYDIYPFRDYELPKDIDPIKVKESLDALKKQNDLWKEKGIRKEFRYDDELDTIEQALYCLGGINRAEVNDTTKDSKDEVDEQ